MIEIFEPIRKAYLTKLASLEYGGVSVPVDSDYLSKPRALLNVGVPPVEAWVILQNQTANDQSPKCAINQDSSLQIDVITQFPKNSGSYAIANQIAGEILAIILPNTLILDLQLPDLQVWRAWVEAQRLITEDNQDNRIFRHLLILNHSIAETNTTT